MTAGRGSAAVVLLAIVAVALAAAALVADVTLLMAGRLQAMDAADAAALAAAPVTFAAFGTDGDPAAAARSVADRNGVTLVACRCVVDPSWTPRRVVVRVVRHVDLVLFGTIEIQVAAAADFDPAELWDA